MREQQAFQMLTADGIRISWPVCPVRLKCLPGVALAVALGMISSGCAGMNEYLTEGIHQVITIRAPEGTVAQVAERIFMAKGYRFSPIKREMLMQPYYRPLAACSSAFYVSLPNQERRWCEIALQPQGEKTFLKVVCFRPHGWPFQDIEGEDFELPSAEMLSLLSQVKQEAERGTVSQ